MGSFGSIEPSSPRVWWRGYWRMNWKYGLTLCTELFSICWPWGGEIFLHLLLFSLKSGFRIRIRIRIRIGSVFNRTIGFGSGSVIWIRIRIQEGKNDPQKFFSSLRMVYFTTFVHNSPRLPLYKYQGETGSIQFVTMIVMSLYECGNTR